MGDFDFNPPGQDERTEAAIGSLGSGYASWQMRGIRVPTSFAQGQVWQGTAAFPVLPPVAGALKVNSSSSSALAAGTGARAVAVIYLNAAFEIRLATGVTGGAPATDLFEFDQVSQTQTAVAVVDAFRVLDVQINTVGSAGTNVGNLEIRIAGVQQAQVAQFAGPEVIRTLFFNRAMPGAFTVPAGFCAVLDSFKAGPGPSIAIQCKPDPRTTAWMGVTGFAPNAVQPIAVQQSYRSPRVFGALSELRFVYGSVETEASETYVAPEASLFLHPDTDTVDSDPAQIPRLNRCGFGV